MLELCQRRRTSVQTLSTATSKRSQCQPPLYKGVPGEGGLVRVLHHGGRLQPSLPQEVRTILKPDLADATLA